MKKYAHQPKGLKYGFI
jgi:hypothetical protein